MTRTLPPQFHLIGNCDFIEEDLYWIFYPEVVISKESRKQLKEAGWNLQRHTRTNKEIWVFPKKEEIEKYQKELANGSLPKTS